MCWQKKTGGFGVQKANHSAMTTKLNLGSVLVIELGRRFWHSMWIQWCSILVWLWSSFPFLDLFLFLFFSPSFGCWWIRIDCSLLFFPPFFSLRIIFPSLQSVYRSIIINIHVFKDKHKHRSTLGYTQSNFLTLSTTKMQETRIKTNKKLDYNSFPSLKKIKKKIKSSCAWGTNNLQHNYCLGRN